WAISIGTGVNQVAARAAAENNQLLFNLAAPHLGPTIVTVGAWLMVTSVLAASLSFHNAVARYGYALGREGVLPRVFGATSRHFSSPKVASLAQSGLAAGFIAWYAIAGLDPLTQGFFWGGMLGGLGCLILYTLAAAAIPAYFATHASDRSPWVKYAAPALAFLALAVITVVAVRDFDVMIGVPAGHPAALTLPATYIAVALAGVAWAVFLKTARPRTFRAIGLGAHAVTGQTTTPAALAQEGTA
ncbi:MAG: amino acid permease, partial [Micromonosporaceae bacterium]